MAEKREVSISFITEVSINLADDEELMNLMVDAAIYSIFIGIETPNNDKSLRNAGRLRTKEGILFNRLRNYRTGVSCIGRIYYRV